MNKIGFDSEKYIQEQTRYILERVQQSKGRLYIECGGKLLHDLHASRVLPGFDPNAKMKVFQSLKEHLDIIICIYAGDIEKRKIRGDFGISYDADVLKMIDDFAKYDIKCNKVVITRFEGQASAVLFKEKLQRMGINVYTHTATPGYPSNIDLVVSPEGYGKNEYIPVEAPVVVVNAPGPGSGKLATCLNQMYHEARMGETPHYSKLETFPIWNLPLDHPVNIAYEAATADLGDVNLIDHFHLQAYGKVTVNYNRDLEAYPLLKKIIERINNSQCPYKSPTDMGVNRCGFGITDDEICREAGRQEIIRRYFKIRTDYASGLCDDETVSRIIAIMDKAQLVPEMRSVVIPAREALKSAIDKGKGKDGTVCGAAIELPDGRIVTAHNSMVLHASSALILNALKVMAGIDKEKDLIQKSVISSVTTMKRDVLNGKGVSLNLDETLIALAMSAAEDSDSRKALEALPKLKGMEVHMTHIPSPGDSAGLRKLGIQFTSDPIYPAKNLI